MKVIVFGATGLVGSDVLNACIKSEKITKIYVLVRRALTDGREKDPKVEVILHSDFTTYPSELLEKLKGIELCLWAIGGLMSKFGNDKKLAYAANVECPRAAATALVERLAPESPTDRIRFVYCSGKYAERDLTKSLWFLSDTRRFKGETEIELQKLADNNPGKFHAFFVRPGLVIPADPPLSTRLTAIVSPGITSLQVGRVMLKIGLDGWKEQVLEQDEMLKVDKTLRQ